MPGYRTGKVAHGGRPFFPFRISMVLELSGREEWECPLHPRPEYDVDSTILSEDAANLLGLESHRIESITDEILKQLRSQLVNQARRFSKALCQNSADAHCMGSKQLELDPSCLCDRSHQGGWTDPDAAHLVPEARGIGDAVVTPVSPALPSECPRKRVRFMTKVL